MNNKSQDTSLSKASEGYRVTLPVDEEQLRAFVSGLLGKPQTIGRVVEGPFEVRRSDIEDLHQLIQQRITAQNAGSLVAFTAKIVYDDASSVLLNSFVEFSTYNEVKLLSSRELHLSWTYLVQFTNKKTLEKQQIELSIFGGSSPRGVVIDSELPSGVVVGRKRSAIMNLRISHTDRTWGADIDALISSRLEHYLTSPSAAKSFFCNYSTWFGWITGLMILGMSLYVTFYVTSLINEQYMSEINKLNVGPATIEALSSRISLLSKYVADGVSNPTTLLTIIFLLVAFLGSIIAGVVVTLYGEIPENSFLILTKKDQENYLKEKAKADKDFIHFLLTSPGALVLGVAGNYAFYLVSKYFSLH